ncbi:hypothetical protein RHGRI_034553 [Rhododendron griersonianum]|uniref:EXS domain-containing protein n=1 Tax=Rhododendron griersonianum TaxID=479676 RepID=A0AAV6I6N1_9ERIC|nr:hypothetical protein RHGRI_034553 [Rhododendron griersonianum]
MRPTLQGKTLDDVSCKNMVTLPDFFLADQLTSQVQAFRSLEFYICYYGWGDYKKRLNTCQDIDVYKAFFFIVAAVPYWIRLLQCLRRLYEERDPRQGFNGPKYLSAIVAVCMRTAYTLNRGSRWNLLAWNASVIAVIFGNYWDLVVDWGLFQKNSKNRWLRDKLLVPHKSVYFAAMVSNVLLRLVWMHTVLNFSVPFLHIQTLTALVAVLEIIRRGIWNFFRLVHDATKICIFHSTESYTTQSYPLQSQPLHAQASVYHEPNFQSIAPQQQSSLEVTIKALMAEIENSTLMTTQSIAELNHFQTQAISKLENQLEQLANRMREIEEEDIYSGSMVNPNWQVASSDTAYSSDEQEHIESTLTLESRVIDEPVSMSVEKILAESEKDNVCFGQGTFTESNHEDLDHFTSNCNIDEIEQIRTLVDSAPWSSIDQWISKGVCPPHSLSPPHPFVMESPDCELKSLSHKPIDRFLEPIEDNPIGIHSHCDQAGAWIKVDHSRDNSSVEWDFVFGAETPKHTHKILIQTLLFKQIFPWICTERNCGQVKTRNLWKLIGLADLEEFW